MFGKNKVMKQELSDGRRLQVKEVFSTIQGEGPRAGQPATFIRLAGCNLRCKFCDTDFEGGYQVDVLDLLAQVHHAKNNLVVISGGEPFRQNLFLLCEQLQQDDFIVQIETAGTLWVPGMEDLDFELVVSPKTPQLNREIVFRADAFKYIVRAGETDHHGLPNRNPQTGEAMLMPSAPPAMPVYIQPCDDHDEGKNQANLQEALRVVRKHGYILSLQQHKIVGLP